MGFYHVIGGHPVGPLARWILVLQLLSSSNAAACQPLKPHELFCSHRLSCKPRLLRFDWLVPESLYSDPAHFLSRQYQGSEFNCGVFRFAHFPWHLNSVRNEEQHRLKTDMRVQNSVSARAPLGIVFFYEGVQGLWEMVLAKSDQSYHELSYPRPEMSNMNMTRE